MHEIGRFLYILRKQRIDLNLYRSCVVIVRPFSPESSSKAQLIHRPLLCTAIKSLFHFKPCPLRRWALCYPYYELFRFRVASDRSDSTESRWDNPILFHQIWFFLLHQLPKPDLCQHSIPLSIRLSLQSLCSALSRLSLWPRWISGFVGLVFLWNLLKRSFVDITSQMRTFDMDFDSLQFSRTRKTLQRNYLCLNTLAQMTKVWNSLHLIPISFRCWLDFWWVMRSDESWLYFVWWLCLWLDFGGNQRDDLTSEIMYRTKSNSPSNANTTRQTSSSNVQSSVTNTQIIFIPTTTTN